MAQINEKDIVWDDKPILDETQIVWDDAPVKKKDATINSNNGFATSSNSASQSKSQSQNKLASNQISPDFSLNLGFPIQKPTINLKTTEQEQSVVGSGVLKSQLPFNNFANVDEIVQEAKTKKTNTENKPIITQYKPKPTVNQQHIADTEQYNPILAEALKGFYGEQGATTTPQTSYSTYDIAKKMTTEQLININNDVFKDVVSQSKGKQQTEFLKESDKNNPVQAFNRESEIYDARIKELKERAGAYESALSSRYGATDFMDTLKKQLADVQQKSKQYEMYVQKRSKEVVALQTELENLKQQAESGTQPREVIEPAFMAKLAQLKAIQSDDEQRRAEIEKIQSDFNSKVSDTDFDMYVQLYNKANELQAEQQGLIMKPEFAEYRKLVDANMKAQIKKDAIKQDYQKKGILGKALDVTKGLALSFNPVALSSTILGGSSLDDISFTASRISDEGDKLAMRTLNAIAAVPKSLEKLNPIGDPNKYDVLDELFDSALYSTKKSEMLNPTATDVQRDIIQKYAIVDGYKVLLDEKGKPTNDVRAKDGFYKVGDKTSEQILQKYTENPKVYKVKEDFSVSTLTTKATPTMLDMGTMMAVTAMTGGSSAAMVGTAAAQMYGGFYESGLQSGLTPQEANDFATITSILTGMVTLVNPMEANIVKGTVSEGIGSIIGKGISKADVQLIRTGKMSIGQYAKRLVKEGVKNTLGENLEEVVLEPAVQRAMEIMYSRNTEQNGGLGFEGLKNDFFDKKQTIETAMITTMASLIMTPVEVANSVPEQRKLALQKALENPQEFIEQRNNMLNGGDYTKEKYDFEVKAFEEISKQYNAVAPEIREDLRDDLSELLLKKYTLKNTMSQVNDEVLNKKNQALLDDVNKRLEEVANGTYDKAKEKVISDAVKQPTPIENDKVATYNGMEVDILDVMPDGMILINTNNPEIGDNGYLEVKRNEITDIKDKPIVTQNEVVPPPIPNENVNANEQQNVEQATAVNIRTEEFDSQTSIDKSIALLPKPQIKKLGIIDKGLDNVFGKIGGGASLSEMTDSNNKKAQDTYDNRVEFIKNNKMFADYYSQASSSQREHLENMIDYYVYNKEEYNPNDVHKYSFVRDNGDVSFTGKGLSSRVEDFKNTPRDKNGYIDWDNAKFSIISPEGKVLKSAIKAEDEDVVLREENNKYNLTPKVNIVNNDKPVIEKIEEVNVPQETVIAEPVDESTAVPASEMDEQQLNQIFEEKIANPQIDEIDNILQKIKKKTVNETEITPNELIEQGREQDVSQGLQGEYQNNQGVQQSSGIGQVSQQEVPTEKVEEKVDEILSTKNEEITPKSSIEVDRNVDRVDNNQENIETSSSKKLKTNGNIIEGYNSIFGEDIVDNKGNVVGSKISDTRPNGKKYYQTLTDDTPENRKGFGWQEHQDIDGKIFKKFETLDDLEKFIDSKKQQETPNAEVAVADVEKKENSDNGLKFRTHTGDAGLSGKELVADALDRIVSKTGGKKNLTPEERTSLTKDITDLAKGLIQMGKATLDNVLEKVTEEIKKRLPDLDNTTVNELAENIEQKVLLSAVVDKFKEKGYSYEQAKEKLDKANADYNEKELKDAWNGRDNSGNTKQAQQEDGVKKRVVTERAYEGTVRDEVKSELEKLGLYRDKISQEERAKQADAIIDRIGEEMALEAVKNFDIRGAVATSVLARLIKRIDDKMINLSATDVDELSALAKEQAELIELMGKEAYFGGEYNAQLGYEYLNSDIGYNVEKKIQEFKDQNNGVIPEDVEKKFRELDAQYQQLKKDYAEAEKRAIEAEQKQAVENIKESIKREKKIRTYSKRGDDLIAEGLDELASYLGTKLMAEGTNRPQLTKALSKIGKGLIDKGIATIDNVFDKVKEYVTSKFGDKVQIDDLKDDIAKGIVDKMPKATIRDGKIFVPHQLIRELVESGIEDINDLAKEIQNRLKGQYPDVEIREIRDAITGYGKTVNPNREEIEKQIRKMKRIGKIESALEDVRNKKRPLRSGVQRDKLETEERARLKELREAMKDLPMDEQTLERELKTQLDAEKTRVQNRIDDLQREIDKNELTPRNARTLKEDTELKALKEKLESVKKEHDEKFKNDDYKEKKRLELSKKLTQNRINELQRRLRENDFSKTVRKPLIADTELIRLKAEKLRIQEEFDKEFYKNKLKNRTKAEKLKDVLFEIWGLTRALRATGEASFVGIQGLVNTISHPTHAKEAFKTAFKTMRSEKYTEDFLRGIKSQEWYPALKGSKLSLTEPHAELSAREELFVSDWFTYLWNALGTPLKANEKAFETWKSANPLKAVERAAVGYLDTLRVMRFLDGMEMLKMKGQTFENNPQAYKDMADVINTLTGRASLGRLEQNADMLSKVFFSPRNWASMLKQTVLLPRQLYKWRDKTPDAKLTEISVANKMALSDLSKFVGLTTAMVAMFAAGLNNDDDDETGVELDPRSSDFAKIKIGKKRIDPWGGRIQQVVLLSKLIMDSVKNSKGEIVPLGVPYKSPTKADLLLRMATNKLSPSMALVNEYLLSTVKFDKQTGEKIRMSPYEYGGGEYDFTDKLLESTYPIYWSTVYDLIKDDTNALNGILAFYAFFGGGVNVYDDKKKDKNNDKTNPTEKDIPFIKK